jgi:hypothetical protein
VDAPGKQKFWALLAVGTLASAVLCLVSAIVFGLIIQATAPTEPALPQANLIQVHVLGRLVYVSPTYKVIEDSLLIAFGVLSIFAILLVRQVFGSGDVPLPRNFDKDRIARDLEQSRRNFYGRTAFALLLAVVVITASLLIFGKTITREYWPAVAVIAVVLGMARRPLARLLKKWMS